MDRTQRVSFRARTVGHPMGLEEARLERAQKDFRLQVVLDWGAISKSTLRDAKILRETHVGIQKGDPWRVAKKANHINVRNLSFK